MNKVNEFETAQDETGIGSKRRFPDEANIHYTYPSAEKLIKNLDDLSEMIQHHEQYQRKRLKTLQEYYKGNNENILIGKRRKEEKNADHRATHNFAKYVSQFIQGYMMGIPLKTTYPDNKEIDEKIRDINVTNDADEHNSELVLNQSIYGRAYELLYRNRDDETRFTESDVLNTFVIYDETVEMLPVAAVRYINNRFTDDTVVHLYLDNKIIEYNLGNDYKLTKEDEESHSFNGVPIIEYQNNKFRQGDFEDVLPLIDLYDAAQSDTANYMTDLNDAMLKIMGNLEIDTKAAQEMKEHNILMLQTEVDAEGRSGQADADYIYKKYDVQGTEAYKDRIFENILLFTNIPNLLDSNFSGTQSGESMKYKLFGLEQKRATKERMFKRSLRDRYRLINNLSTVASEGDFDVNEIDITFTENLPKNIATEIEWFSKMGGELSQETMLSQLSFIDNAQEEIDRINDEDVQFKQGRDMYEDNNEYKEETVIETSEGIIEVD